MKVVLAWLKGGTPIAKEVLTLISQRVDLIGEPNARDWAQRIASDEGQQSIVADIKERLAEHQLRFPGNPLYP